MATCRVVADTLYMKIGTGKWYSEKGTTTEPCESDPTMEWIVRCGKKIALVKKATK